MPQINFTRFPISRPIVGTVNDARRSLPEKGTARPDRVREARILVEVSDLSYRSTGHDHAQAARILYGARNIDRWRLEENE